MINRAEILDLNLSELHLFLPNKVLKTPLFRHRITQA